MHPRLRERHFHAQKIALQFCKALLFLRSKVCPLLHNVPNISFDCMPTQVVLLIGFPPPELHTTGVVVNETTGPVQKGVAVTANTVFIAQEYPGIDRRRIHGVKGSNPQFSAFEPRTAPENMLDFFVR